MATIGKEEYEIVQQILRLKIDKSDKNWKKEGAYIVRNLIHVAKAWLLARSTPFIREIAYN